MFRIDVLEKDLINYKSKLKLLKMNSYEKKELESIMNLFLKTIDFYKKNKILDIYVQEDLKPIYLFLEKLKEEF